jgi:hypothetical protein
LIYTRENIIKYAKEALDRFSALTAELAALREEMGKKEENYEKVWDAAIKRDYYEKYSAMELWQHLEIPPDKTTFINKIKKGKEERQT